MNKCCWKNLLLIILFALSASVNAQIKSIGVPYIRNFERSQYGAATQNWDIVQNEDGVLYFANNEGVMEFDGTNWRVYPISNQSIPRSLHIGKDGKVWVGAYDEFGYLKVDSRGELKYFSIRNLVPDNYKNIGEVWSIHESEGGIYFQAFNILLFYNFEEIRVIEGYNDYHFSFYVNNRLFIQDKDEGLKELRGEKLYLIEGGEKFIDDIEVWQMIPFSIDTILIATQRNGLFLYDGYKIQNYEFKLNNYLIDKQIYSLEMIQDKYLVFGTIQAGLIVTDLRGNLIQHIDKSKGLQNNTILSLFVDRNKQIWLGLDNGIDFIEIHSAFTFLNDALGIEGTGYTAALYKGNLYLGTNQGLYFKKWDDINKIGEDNFKVIDNTYGQVWSLQNIDEKLFCGHNIGTFIDENGILKKISDENGGWMLTRWNKNDSIIIGGTYSNLTKYVKDQGGNWSFWGVLPGLHESCRLVLIDSLDNVWVSHDSKGIYKIRLSNTVDSVISNKLYNSKNGLPSDLGNYLFELYGQIIVCTDRGIYKYNYSTDKFEKSIFFNKIFGENNRIASPKLDDNGNIWCYKNGFPAMFIKESNKWKEINIPFNKYGNIFVDAFENSLIIDKTDILFGTEKGFIHFNPLLVDSSRVAFKTLIRNVKLTKPFDSLLFNGNYQHSGTEQELLIPYKMNAIKFGFTAPLYESPEKIKYRFKLDGFDKRWSEWKTNATKEYTNLPPGNYIFEVESRNINNQIGEKASYSFTILPPWYRTYWAYIGYFIILILSLLYLLKTFEKRFDRAKAELKKKEQEKLKKKEEEFARENLLNEQKIIKLKNEKLESEILQRKTEAEMKNKELASVAIQITHKNEILSNLKTKIETISKKVNTQAQQELKQLIKTIDEDLKLDKDWDQFKKHFEEVHADFFKRLRTNYSELTPKDLKMCAYLRMNLSTKEIAPLMNISVRGVEISRYRLRKKLDLHKDANLIEFMLNV